MQWVSFPVFVPVEAATVKEEEPVEEDEPVADDASVVDDVEEAPGEDIPSVRLHK